MNKFLSIFLIILVCLFSCSTLDLSDQSSDVAIVEPEVSAVDEVEVAAIDSPEEESTVVVENTVKEVEEPHFEEASVSEEVSSPVESEKEELPSSEPVELVEEVPIVEEEVASPIEESFEIENSDVEVAEVPAEEPLLETEEIAAEIESPTVSEIVEAEPQNEEIIPVVSEPEVVIEAEPEDVSSEISPVVDTAISQKVEEEVATVEKDVATVENKTLEESAAPAVTVQQTAFPKPMLDKVVSPAVLQLISVIIVMTVLFTLSVAIRGANKMKLQKGISFALSLLFTALSIIVSVLVAGWSYIWLLYLILLLTYFIFRSRWRDSSFC